MPDIVQFQLMASRYGSELAARLHAIERAVEGGQQVTIRLVDGDLELTLKFEGMRACTISDPAPVRVGEPPPRLADSAGLVATLTGSFAFDLQEAEREIPASEAAQRLDQAASLRVDDAAVRARLAAGLPLTEISQMGGDEYFLVSDCTYRTNGGHSITVLKGFRTDLASIPRLLLPFIPVRDLSITAPTFHDLIYRTGGCVAPPLGTIKPADKIYSKVEADDLFLELMTREGVGYFKRNLAYAAVRLGGRSAWKGT